MQLWINMWKAWINAVNKKYSIRIVGQLEGKMLVMMTIGCYSLHKKLCDKT